MKNGFDAFQQHLVQITTMIRYDQKVALEKQAHNERVKMAEIVRRGLDLALTDSQNKAA